MNALPAATIIARRASAGLGLGIEVAVTDRPAAENELNAVERERLEAFTSPLRITSWLTGRAALKALRRRFGESDDTTEIPFPNPRYSLSHCQESAIAAGVPARGEAPCVRGVGVDLEFMRPLPPRAGRFFLTAREQAWVRTWDAWSCPQSLLALWCIKEAVFKANPDNEGTLLAHYELEEPVLGHGYARGPAGPEGAPGRRLRYVCIDTPDAYLAFAVCAD